METWKFYHSGILYGTIAFQHGHWMHQTLNPESALMGEWCQFTDNGIYTVLCSRNIFALVSDLDEFNSFIRTLPDSFTTSDGEVFAKRRDNSYIQRHCKFPTDLIHQNGKVIAVLMPGRDYCSVLVKEGMEQEINILGHWNSMYGTASIHPVSFHGSFTVRTRDGELLATDVYLPGNMEHPVPSVLVRTPYGKRNGCEQYFRFVQRGYAVIIQDTRGREDSTGEWLPNYYEIEDGDDTLNWIADQSFSDGQAAMTGGSYLGYVQWAAAASGNPHLKAMLSSVCAGSAFVDVPRRGGCFNSGMLAWGFAMTEKRMRGDLMVRDDWEHVLNIRPLKDLPRKALGHDVPFLSTWLEHMDYDDLWKRSSWKERFQGNAVPALIMSGWFDDNGMGTTEALELTASYPPNTCKVVLGPWMHSGNANYDLHGVYLGQDALRYDMDILCFQWLEHFLKGVQNGIEASTPVEYYTVGDNVWKTTTSWPVPETVPVVYYLDGENNDCAAGNRGRLCTAIPENPGWDSYDYDPENPSIHIVDMSENELEVPENYTEEEKRPDVLCYSTPTLMDDLTVTGDIQVKLYVSSDCPDTDFMVRLTDVDENGTSIKLADGVISAKYRNGFETPEFMEAGTVYKIPIRTTKISNTFKKGHKMRFTITSSAKNFIFPNSNTVQGFDSEVNQIAHNVVHRGGGWASCLEIRVEK